VDDCHSITSVRTASRLSRLPVELPLSVLAVDGGLPRRVPIGSALGDSCIVAVPSAVSNVVSRTVVRSTYCCVPSNDSAGLCVGIGRLGRVENRCEDTGPPTWGNRNQSTEPFGATSSRRRSQRPPIAISRVSEPEWARGSLATSSRHLSTASTAACTTKTTFAYWRHRDRDLAVHPGQDIEHVVDDNEKSTRDRVSTCP